MRRRKEPGSFENNLLNKRALPRKNVGFGCSLVVGGVHCQQFFLPSFHHEGQDGKLQTSAWTPRAGLQTHTHTLTRAYTCATSLGEKEKVGEKTSPGRKRERGRKDGVFCGSHRKAWEQRRMPQSES